MNESPKRKRPSVLALAAAVLTVPAFGGGLLLGKSTVERTSDATPSATDERAESAPDDAASTELAVCQRKLARRSKAKSVSSATVARSDESDDAGAQTQGIDALEREIKSCRRSELVHGAELCRTVRLYLDALLGLPKNDVLCVQRVRVSDYIEDDFEKCAAFKTTPADLAAYSDEERKTILDAVDVAKTLDHEKLAEHLNEIHRSCYGVGKDSP